VADSKKTIDENLDLIIDDLLVQCGSRLWRSREASCLALADIIQGRKFHEVIKITIYFKFECHAQNNSHEILKIIAIACYDKILNRYYGEAFSVKQFKSVVLLLLVCDVCQKRIVSAYLVMCFFLFLFYGICLLGFYLLLKLQTVIKDVTY
jgi:hypothetical protein